MKSPTPTAPVDPVLVSIAAAWLAAEALLALTVAAVALVLTLAGWRPAATPASPAPLLPAPLPPEQLRVVELRRLARAAGHPRLARSGRRAELLEALALAPG